MTTKYLSEIISNEEISTWKPGDNIFLYNGTGTGKTTFINNRLDCTPFTDIGKVDVHW